MAITIKHAKTDNIADWTQADLDAQIALGNYPAGTVLADIVLPSDWNNSHTISGTVPIANGGTGVTSSSGANSVVLRDANGNITTNCLFEGFTSQANGSLITLTASSVQNWVITGSGGQTIKLPDATTLPSGALFTFNNNQSSGTIVVQNNSGTTIDTLQSGSFSTVVLLNNSTAAGSWDKHDQAPANVSWSTNTFDYPGSITSATWNGNAIALNRGGTNANLTAVNGGAVYSTGTALAISAAGTSGQVLTSSGAGAPTWTTPTTGTVTSVTGTSPVVSSGGNTPAISMPAATTSVSGYLTSTDWTTFNNKGSGTVTSASVVSANGFAGTVANSTTTPAITLTTSITGVLKGNGTAIIAATSGTDYSAGTSANTTGLVYSTTTTGALTTATAAQIVAGIGSTAVTNSTNTTNILSGAANQIPYQTGAGATSFITAPVTSSTYLQWNGTSFAWASPSGAGTVTSVALTAPSIFTVTGSPITSSGTLALTYSGTALPVANGGTNATSAGITAFNNITGYTASGATGTTSTNIVFSTSPTLTTPTIGVAASTQVNFTNTAVTVTSNAGTVPINTRLNTFTNSSAASMTITMATTSATDGQMSIVRIYDFSAVAQSISWVNTENSTVTVPATSNGSTTLPLTVGFMYNAATSKWRCIASA